MKTRKIWFLLLWVFSPIVLLIEGLREKDPKLKKYALILFVTAFGFTIVLIPGVDGDSHVLRTEHHYMDMSFTSYLDILYDIVTFQETSIGVKDVFMHTLSYVSGSVLGYPRAMFLIVSLIYGYFFIGSMTVFFKNFSQTPKTIVFILLALTLIFTKNVEGIQSIRNWTACWMAIYAFLRYNESKSIKFIALICLTPFIHFSYLIIALPLVVIMILRVRPLVYFIIFILSTFTNTIEPLAIKNLQMSQFFDKQVNSYYKDTEVSATEKYDERTQKGESFQRAFAQSNLHRIPTIIITGLIFLLIGIKRKTISLNRRIETVFFGGVLMLSLSNFSWFLTSLSNRTLIISMILILAATLMLYQNNFKNIQKNNFFNTTLFFCLLLYLPYIYYSVSVLLLFTSICMLFLPPFVLFFPDDNISIHNVLRN